jgi:hypothetical protein
VYTLCNQRTWTRLAGLAGLATLAAVTPQALAQRRTTTTTTTFTGAFQPFRVGNGLPVGLNTTLGMQPFSPVRFARPYLTNQLDEDIEDCDLFHDPLKTVLATLGEGATLVLNLGLVESFSEPFICLPFKVREIVKAFKGRLVLCCLSPGSHRLLQAASGESRFNITPTEERAIYEAAV